MKETVVDWGEKRIIQELMSGVALLPGTIGIGDDAAVLHIPSGESLAISTDRVPSDLIAARLGFIKPKQLGRYVVEVNISDLIAMGAQPMGFLLNLGLPPEYLIEDLQELLTGVINRGNDLGAPLVGGDTKESGQLELVGIAIGHLPLNDAVRRSGASPGDRLLVSGSIGGFGAALAYFLRKDISVSLPPEVENVLIQLLVEPVARIDLLEIVRGTCTACIDITDGFGEAVAELERAGSCEFDIDSHLIPIHPVVEQVADLLKVSSIELSFGIGLDLQLLCCVPPTSEIPGMFQIGVARAKTGRGSQVLIDGKSQSLPTNRYQHFKADAAKYVVK